MEAFLDSLVTGAPVLIGFVVVVALAGTASYALHRRDMRWVQKEAQELDGHRARIESGYGIRVSRDHVRRALQSPHSGVVSRAVMGDESLEEITLRGTEPVPYRKDGSAWRIMPLISEAEAPAGGRR